MSTTLTSTPGLVRRAEDPDPLTSSSMAPMERIVEAGHSLEEARLLAHRLYTGARFSRSAIEDGFAFRFASVGGPEVSLRRVSLTTPLVVDVDHLDDYVATWFRDGAATLRTTRSSVDVPVERPAILPSTSPFTLEMGPGRQSLVHVGRPFLDRVATESHGGATRPIVFCSNPLPDDAGLARWREGLSAATPIITDADAGPLLRMEADLAIARAMLSVFTWHTDHIPPALLVTRLARVREAMEFLHDNAHLPIAPADAAAHAGIHTRSLQNAFQRHLDVSPTEYLRAIRLDRVRRDLVEHTPETATVSDLARAWGFGNQGRFAAAYRLRFGERPNETLRR